MDIDLILTWAWLGLILALSLAGMVRNIRSGHNIFMAPWECPHCIRQGG